MKKIVLAKIIVFSLLLASIGTNSMSQSIERNNIQNNLEHESIAQIFNSVINLKEGNIAKLLNQFSGNNSNWMWTVQESKLPENINAVTISTSDGMVTTFDYNKLSKATRLAAARTIIHEMLHAYLTLYFEYDALNAQEEFPMIVLAWNTSVKPDYNYI